MLAARVEVAPQTVELIGRELTAALDEARSALEAFVEQSGNSGLIDRVAVELHRVQGVLRMLEVYGGALLAEEMEQVARYLIGTASERKNQAETLDALLRAMEQLPGYLDRVLAGGRDLALVLLPLLNDLRAVRGSPLLSEGTLLLLNLRSDVTAAPKTPATGDAAMLVAQSARRLRPQFQVGLVGWIRGERPAENLATLALVAQRMEELATHQPVYQLWWVTGGVLEALRDGGLEDSVSIKRLLGLADRELKRLYEQGEARYCQSPPVELLNNLLYYIARATTNGPRTTAVRAAFRLDELLPVDQDVEEERETLSAPSIKLMQTVARAIREDLGKVKDTLDIFVRRAGGQPAELAPQIEMLRKIGDTLGVLGLGELRGEIQGELARLEAIVSGRVASDESSLIGIASTLIKVEDRLDGSLMQMIVPARKGDSVARDGAGEPASEEFLHVQAAVLRECIVNLARIKEAVAQNVAGTLDPAGLDAWPELMRGIRAGLLLLGRTRALAICESIGECLQGVMQPGGAGLATSYLDRLADAMVSVEYYMETLQAGRAEPGWMLDNAQACLDAISATPAAVAPVVPALPEAAFSRTVRLDDSGVPRTEVLPGAEALATAANGAATPTVQPAVLDLGETARRLRALAEEEQAGPPREPPVLAAAPAATLPPAGRLVPTMDEVDPEIRGVFVEEAREEVARIERTFPEWERNPGDHEALGVVRRAFHTLKGSGRMVGAGELAEYAWSVENLLNRVIDGTLTRGPEVMTCLREAVAVAPALVDALVDGRAVQYDVARLVATAHALAAGQPVPSAVVTMQPAPGAAPPAVVAPDAALREIFERETDTHVAMVRDYVAREQLRPEPHRLPEAVHRACHTLSGSSQMAQARHGVRLAEPLNHWIRKAWSSGAGLRDGDLALLADCMAAMEQVARRLDETTQFFVAHDVLRSRIAAAESDLDRRLAEHGRPEADEPAAAPSPVAPVFEAPAATSEPVAAFEPEAGSALAAAPEPIAAAPALAPALGPAGLPRAGADDASADAADEGFDPEVAAIFTDEATELLEASEVALAAWRAVPEDAASVAALKRPLHTLKGGARMAGVRSMGDLAHELETTIGQIELGLVAADARALSAVQGGLDELARMRDQLAAGRAPARSEAGLHALRALVGPPAEAPSTPAEVVSPPPEASVVPAGSVVERAVPAAASVEGAAPEAAAPTPAESAASPGAPAYPVAPSLAVPPGREAAPAPAEAREMARVDADLLDSLLNNAGEVSIGRARLEQQVGAIGHNLGELSRTVTRLKEQLRKLEIETEKQILHRVEAEGGAHRGDFDPLELDRYSSIQQFSRALAETASDVASIQQLLETLTQDTENLLQQQARVVTELQNGLMRTRMVPFQRHVQRLARIVRQAAAEEGKQAELVVDGATGELDRQVLERMLGPFEHILRNAVVHGIEMPAERLARGKAPGGRITMGLRREGAEVIVEVADDGAGLNLDAIRAKGRELGLLGAGRDASDAAVMQLILEPGFSTAGRLTQHAGRGVGMDVVATEVKKLGGALHIESREGEGARFVVRLPFTLAISHALVVRVEDELYALPLPVVEGVVRLGRDEVQRHLASEGPSYDYSGIAYRLQPLATFVGLAPGPLPAQDTTMPVVLVRSGEYSTGLVVDELVGSREIVVKNVGPQIAAIRGISGATVLGDGRVVIILDISALLRADWRTRVPLVSTREKSDAQPVALVVDDSITVRRVTQRLLERNGMRVLTARDGLDAVAILGDTVPDVILLDIEMPRMDGYEVAAQVRSDPRTRDVPIIMITSRVGEKHRARAIELGVEDYLGKPYQEAQLLEAIEPLIARRRRAGGAADG